MNIEQQACTDHIFYQPHLLYYYTGWKSQWKNIHMYSYLGLNSNYCCIHRYRIFKCHWIPAEIPFAFWRENWDVDFRTNKTMIPRWNLKSVQPELNFMRWKPIWTAIVKCVQKDTFHRWESYCQSTAYLLVTSVLVTATCHCTLRETNVNVQSWSAVIIFIHIGIWTVVLFLLLGFCCFAS